MILICICICICVCVYIYIYIYPPLARTVRRHIPCLCCFRWLYTPVGISYQDLPCQVLPGADFPGLPPTKQQGTYSIYFSTGVPYKKTYQTLIVNTNSTFSLWGANSACLRSMVIYRLWKKRAFDKQHISELRPRPRATWRALFDRARCRKVISRVKKHQQTTYLSISDDAFPSSPPGRVGSFGVLGRRLGALGFGRTSRRETPRERSSAPHEAPARGPARAGSGGCRPSSRASGSPGSRRRPREAPPPQRPLPSRLPPPFRGTPEASSSVRGAVCGSLRLFFEACCTVFSFCFIVRSSAPPPEIVFFTWLRLVNFCCRPPYLVPPSQSPKDGQSPTIDTMPHQDSPLRSLKC